MSTLQNLFTLAFVVTSMLSMGLSLTVSRILQPLRNPRLVVMSLAANFVLVPAAALNGKNKDETRLISDRIEEVLMFS